MNSDGIVIVIITYYWLFDVRMYDATVRVCVLICEAKINSICWNGKFYAISSPYAQMSNIGYEAEGALGKI